MTVKKTQKGIGARPVRTGNRHRSFAWRAALRLSPEEGDILIQALRGAWKEISEAGYAPATRDEKRATTRLLATAVLIEVKAGRAMMLTTLIKIALNQWRFERSLSVEDKKHR